MSGSLHLSCPDRHVAGTVRLESSKSLSNRALIIRSLCDQAFVIDNLSGSDDTLILQEMLRSDNDSLYAGHAGTAYRFMLARACLYDRPVILDGSEQLRRRPIGPLVEALRRLGADIAYLGQPGYPPVRVSPAPGFGASGEVDIEAGISSQFVSALLLIAPCLPRGLVITMQGKPVSRSYTDMTIRMMRHFGVDVAAEGDRIVVPPGGYTPVPYVVEGDWSGASYFFSMAALAENADVVLEGVSGESGQGDAVVRDIYRHFGVMTEPVPGGLRLIKARDVKRMHPFSFDFTDCPDLAQTVMVTLGGLGLDGHLAGVKTLQWKETHRLTAMRDELDKVRVKLAIYASGDEITASVAGKADWRGEPAFDTYDDHRMAMALAALALIGPVSVADPDVVRKSFPDFWRQVAGIGVGVRGM
jgi:3-phosphoshikimate 1-carboxyvinyltransferase